MHGGTAMHFFRLGEELRGGTYIAECVKLLGGGVYHRSPEKNKTKKLTADRSRAWKFTLLSWSADKDVETPFSEIIVFSRICSFINFYFNYVCNLTMSMEPFWWWWAIKIYDSQNGSSLFQHNTPKMILLACNKQGRKWRVCGGCSPPSPPMFKHSVLM
jgi:hypothetical protein